jgi:ribosomal protein S18 acetylase RimI-like enzyme
MPISEITDGEALRALLIQDRVGNAYLLGDLDPAYAPFCRWFALGDHHRIDALALLYNGLRFPTLLFSAPRADRDAPLGELLAGIKHHLPEQLWVQVWDAHRAALQDHVSLARLCAIQRMALHRDDHRPGLTAARPTRRLTHTDTGAIIALYQHYPDNFFEPYQLESGLYFGVEEEGLDGLAAIAGVHVVSRAHDIAAIGNITTHPDLRGRGHASAVTRRLLEELFKSVSLVTLNVNQDNAAATALFKKFGFAHHHTYYEGLVEVSPSGAPGQGERRGS